MLRPTAMRSRRAVLLQPPFTTLLASVRRAPPARRGR